jgi:protein TonB
VAPPITTTPEPPPVEYKIEPPPPPAPPPAPPAPARSDITAACPQQVKPEIPRKALQEGTSGVVKAQARISGGQVKEVTILSGPRVFHAAVKAAMMQYQCVSSSEDVIATQEFEFKIE